MSTRLLIGWFTTFSDSEVVKPTPVKADRAWNLADSRESPVYVNATVAIRVTRIDRVKTTSSEIIEIIDVSHTLVMHEFSVFYSGFFRAEKQPEDETKNGKYENQNDPQHFRTRCCRTLEYIDDCPDVCDQYQKAEKATYFKSHFFYLPYGLFFLEETIRNVVGNAVRW
jgi:hypothetical protein